MSKTNEATVTNVGVLMMTKDRVSVMSLPGAAKAAAQDGKDVAYLYEFRAEGKVVGVMTVYPGNTHTLVQVQGACGCAAHDCYPTVLAAVAWAGAWLRMQWEQHGRPLSEGKGVGEIRAVGDGTYN